MAIRLDTSDGEQLLITFLLEPDQPPGAVSVVGSFNDWAPGRHQLQSDADDPMRRVTVAVPYGEEVHFRYLAADGLWFDDPDADDVTEHGSVVRATTAPAMKKTPTAKKTPAAKKTPGARKAPAKKAATKQATARKTASKKGVRES